MGCKGKKRRERNYEAAHGGKNSRLPPPPDSSSVDALPSKLRRIMPFMGDVKKPSISLKQNNGSGGDGKGIRSGEKSNITTSGTKRKANDESLITPHMEHDDDVLQSSTVEENKKKKKKRAQSKQANDLRFEKGDESGAVVSKRKERKKQRLEERKKKNKRNRKEDDVDFPGHEKVKFGDIVEAPPKLTVVPKGFNINQDASKERLRLQAIEAYRKRKGWESRPGVQLPIPAISSPLL